MLVKFVVICLLIFSAAAQISEITLTDDDVFTLTCMYEASCAKDTIIRATEGYLLRIVVQSVDINGDSGDFLLIKSGTQIDDGLTGRLFTYRINNEKEYISISNTVLVHFYVNETELATTKYEGFSLTAQRFGEVYPTSEEPTTEIPLPLDVAKNLTVNMSIRNFSVGIDTFREVVAQMAINFISGREEYFGSNLDIGPEDVNITRTTRCPANWPNRIYCYKITFTLPILIPEGANYYGQYQLNQSNLADMWENATDYFDGSYIYVYQLSDHRSNFIAWMIVICGVVVIFGIAYLVIGRICSQRIRRKRASMEKEQEDISDNQRNSVIILQPSSFQSVPELFQNDSTFYEPDTATHFTRPSGLADPFEENILNRNNLQYFEVQTRRPERGDTTI